MLKIDYKKLDQSALIDLLAKHTAAYTKLLSSNGNREELAQLKRTIDSLQEIIQSQDKPGSSLPNPGWTSAN